MALFQELMDQIIHRVVERVHSRAVEMTEAYEQHIKEMRVVLDALKAENAQLKGRIESLEQRPDPRPCLPELTRVALDTVRKWDSDVRVEDQRRRIAELEGMLRNADDSYQQLELECRNLSERLGFSRRNSPSS